MKLYLNTLLLLGLLNFSAKAAIVINSVSIGGASNVIRLNDKSWRVYGSFLGPDRESDSTSFIDSCAEDLGANSSRFVGCNKRRVLDTTVLSIEFNDDVQFVGTRNVVAYEKINGTGVATINNITPLANTNINYPQGAQFQVQITWATLCTRFGGTIQSYTSAASVTGLSAKTCMLGSNPANKQIQIGVGILGENGLANDEILIDLIHYTPEPTRGLFEPGTFGGVVTGGSDGHEVVSPCDDFNKDVSTGTSRDSAGGTTIYDGFCNYQVLPGDEKLRIESDPTIVSSLSSYSGNNGFGNASNDLGFSVPLTGFVMYVSNTDFGATYPWNNIGSSTNLLINAGNPSTGFVDSSISNAAIKNDIRAFTRIATLDEANNITHLFSDGVINAVCGGTLTSPPDPSADLNYYLGTNPPTGLCPYATIPSLVTGLLEEDINCFVATALKGSPYDYQVLALREFRNRFLKSFSLGRQFIDFYYEKGPLAAAWLNAHPSYKSFFRILLWPAYAMAFSFNNYGLWGGLVFLLLAMLTPFLTYKGLRKTFNHS